MAARTTLGNARKRIDVPKAKSNLLIVGLPRNGYKGASRMSIAIGMNEGRTVARKLELFITETPNSSWHGFYVNSILICQPKSYY